MKLPTALRHAAPAILTVALLAAAAYLLGSIEAARRMALSPLIIGVVLGLIGANTFRSRLPAAWDAGFRWCSKRVLRTAIVFYGFRITLQQLFDVGATAFAVDAAMVASTFGLAMLAGRWLGIDRQLTALTGAGSAICGAAAVLATEPVVRAESYKTVTAVSTVVVFGTLSMFLYPIMYRAGWMSALSVEQTGIYVGASVHEVAHVVGAGNAIAPDVAATATITKMIRVVLLAPFLLLLGAMWKRTAAASQPSPIAIPWFAIGFLAMIALNSLLDVGTHAVGIGAAYHAVVGWINAADTFALTMAMTAIGLDAGFDKFRRAGGRPFLLALILDGWLIGGGYLLARWVG